MRIFLEEFNILMEDLQSKLEMDSPQVLNEKKLKKKKLKKKKLKRDENNSITSKEEQNTSLIKMPKTLHADDNETFKQIMIILYKMLEDCFEQLAEGDAQWKKLPQGDPASQEIYKIYYEALNKLQLEMTDFINNQFVKRSQELTEEQLDAISQLIMVVNECLEKYSQLLTVIKPQDEEAVNAFLNGIEDKKKAAQDSQKKKNFSMMDWSNQTTSLSQLPQHVRRWLEDTSATTALNLKTDLVDFLNNVPSSPVIKDFLDTFLMSNPLTMWLSQNKLIVPITLPKIPKPQRQDKKRTTFKRDINRLLIDSDKLTFKELQEEYFKNSYLNQLVNTLYKHEKVKQEDKEDLKKICTNLNLFLNDKKQEAQARTFFKKLILLCNNLILTLKENPILGRNLIQESNKCLNGEKDIKFLLHELNKILNEGELTQ